MKLRAPATGCLLAAIVMLAAWGVTAGAPAATTQATTGATSAEAGRLEGNHEGGGALESARVAGRKDGDGRGGVGGWLQPLAALAVVIVLIFILRAVLQRLTGPRRVGATGTVVEVLHRSHLGGRCEVCLVRLGRRLLLVGLGASGPVTLCEIRDEQEAQALLADLAGPGDRRSGGGTVRDVTEKIRSRLAGEAEAQD